MNSDFEDNLQEKYDQYSDLNERIRSLKRERNRMIKDGADAGDVREVEFELGKLTSARNGLEKDIKGRVRSFTGKEPFKAEDAAGPFLVAVASSNGKRVNLHVREAARFYLYEVTGRESTFVEERIVPAGVRAEKRLDKVLGGCDAVLALKIPAAYYNPLIEKGIRPITVREDFIDSVLDDVFPEIAEYKSR